MEEEVEEVVLGCEVEAADVDVDVASPRVDTYTHKAPLQPDLAHRAVYPRARRPDVAVAA